MSINGLAGLLSSEATREVKVPGGFSLVFKKMQLKDYVEKELRILSSRRATPQFLEEAAEALLLVKDKGVRQAVLEGIQAAVKEMGTKSAFAYFEEVMAFDLSPRGKAYTLWLCVKDNTEIEEDEAYALLESTLPEEVRTEIDEAINWSYEAEYLKKPDTPDPTSQS